MYPRKLSRILSLLFVVIALIVFYSPPFAAAKSASPACTRVANPAYAQAIAQAQPLIEQLQATYQVPGLAVAVAVDGKLVWSAGFGYADIEAQVRACPSTKFRIASITKTLTSAAMARLYERGQFDLDAPIQRYLPDFPKKNYTVTPRLLASHQAGISTRMWSRTEQYTGVQDSLSYFKDDPLIYIPGSGYAYSNLGYELLAASLEGATDMAYPTLLQRTVLGPLGMKGTVPDAEGLANRSQFYSLRGGKLLPAKPQNLQAILGAGGYLSTSEDLVRFGSAMLGDSFLNPGTIQMLWAEQQTTKGLKTHYGLGWMTRADQPEVVGHAGQLGGTRSYLLVGPQQGVVVAMLANLHWDQAWPPVEGQQIITLFSH